MKLRNRVYLLSGGVYGKIGNVYVIQHQEGYVMIDCGRYDALQTILVSYLIRIIQPEDITHVLLTHGHSTCYHDYH